MATPCEKDKSADSAFTNGEAIISRALLYPHELGREAIPRKICHILWDIDGTVTKADEPYKPVIEFMARSAEQGVIHSAITGRDRAWMMDVLGKSLNSVIEELHLDRVKVLSNIRYYPEIGLLVVDPQSGEPRTNSPRIQTHPLVTGTIRDRIANFFLQEKNLQKPVGKELEPPIRNYVIRDANGMPFYVPFIYHDFPSNVIFPDFIWSKYKELIGTAEVVRDAESRVTPLRQKKILTAASSINAFLQYWDASDEIMLSPVATAINIVPVINNIPLDKDWAAGKILLKIQQDLREKGTEVTVEELAAVTMGIGDGYADFLFSRPRIEANTYLDVAFMFVGPDSQMHDDPDKTKNLVIRPQGYYGAEVTQDILVEYGDRFVPLASIKS